MKLSISLAFAAFTLSSGISFAAEIAIPSQEGRPAIEEHSASTSGMLRTMVLTGRGELMWIDMPAPAASPLVLCPDPNDSDVVIACDDPVFVRDYADKGSQLINR